MIICMGFPTVYIKILDFMEESMESRKEYRSSIRSKKMIKEAFFSLIQEKPIEKITVTDIVNKADINRSTFYAHYPDIRGIMETFEDEIIEKMNAVLKDFKYKNFFANPLPVLLKINRYLEDDIEFYRILICQPNSSVFLGKMSDEFIQYMRNDSDVPDMIKHSVMFEMRINFFVGGIVHMYEQWFLGKMHGELNDISMEVSKIIAESSTELF